MLFKLSTLLLVLNLIRGYYTTSGEKRNGVSDRWLLNRHPQFKHIQQLKQKENEKVKIQVYYESLCPFSMSFYSEDLNDTVNHLGPHLDYQTYPYGNAKTNIDKDGKVTITCQHGSDECYGNKIHACAVDALGMIPRAIIYISCMMDNHQSNGRSNDKAADSCGKRFNVDSEPIKACAKGDKGFQLLKYYGDETVKVKSPKIGVPFILINGEYYNMETNFKELVCKTFKNPPQECKKQSVKSSERK